MSKEKVVEIELLKNVSVEGSLLRKGSVVTLTSAMKERLVEGEDYEVSDGVEGEVEKEAGTIPAEVDLGAMKKADLEKLAKAKNIDISKAKNNAERVELLKAHQE